MSAPVVSAPVVEVSGLTVDFVAGRKPIRAVSGLDLTLARGETLALLGESGSGKSVTLRALMRLFSPKVARIGGSIRVDGRDVLALGRRDLATYRGGTVSMIFQEPGLAFDPVYRIGDQIAEAIVQHEGIDRHAARARALDLFERVRIPSAKSRLDNYPHEMSGGMRQRAMIALALSCRPKVLLADEPTTALDATVQIQILLLLRELQRELGLAVIFVTHDIGVAVEIANRVNVMYAGLIVEAGPLRELIRAPRHPYTVGLLASRGHLTTERGHLPAIRGAPPDLAALPPGCPFAPRCDMHTADCEVGLPPSVIVGPTHAARCIHTERVALPVSAGAP